MARVESSNRQRKPRTEEPDKTAAGGNGTPAAAPASQQRAAKARQRPRSGRQKTSRASEHGQTQDATVTAAQPQARKPGAAVQLEQLQQERQRRQQQQQQQQRQQLAKQQGQQEQQGRKEVVKQEQQVQKEAVQQDQVQRAGGGRKRWLRRRLRQRQRGQGQGQQLAEEQQPQPGGSRGDTSSPQGKSKLPLAQRQQRPMEEGRHQGRQKEREGEQQLQPQHQQQRQTEQQQHQTPVLQGSAAPLTPSQVGTSLASNERAAGALAAARSTAARAPSFGERTQDATAQQGQGGDAAAPAQAASAPQVDRQQAQALLRRRLEQLHAQQEQQQAASASSASGRPDVLQQPLVAAGAAAAASGQAAQQQVQPAPRAQLGWGVDAAEVLCSIGMSPEEAARVLQAAHAYMLRRRQAAPGRSSAGQQTESGAAAGDAALATTPARDSLHAQVTSAHVESVCRMLADVAQVPVGRMRGVLARAPHLLGCTAEELHKQVRAGGVHVGSHNYCRNLAMHTPAGPHTINLAKPACARPSPLAAGLIPPPLAGLALDATV